MGRLIDADELKKQLEYGVWNDIIKEIDDMPTAYAPDKVVEQLEEAKHMAVNKTTSKNILAHIDWVEGIDKAIEIVKAGGK